MIFYRLGERCSCQTDLKNRERRELYKKKCTTVLTAFPSTSFGIGTLPDMPSLFISITQKSQRLHVFINEVINAF